MAPKARLLTFFTSSQKDKKETLNESDSHEIVCVHDAYYITLNLSQVIERGMVHDIEMNNQEVSVEEL